MAYHMRSRVVVAPSAELHRAGAVGSRARFAITSRSGHGESFQERVSQVPADPQEKVHNENDGSPTARMMDGIIRTTASTWVRHAEIRRAPNRSSSAAHRSLAYDHSDRCRPGCLCTFAQAPAVTEQAASR